MEKDFFIGEVKAVYKRNSNRKTPNIMSPDDAENYIRKIFPKGEIELREIAGALLLNQSNKIVGHTFLSFGAMSATILDIRLLFQKILLTNSVGFIFFHNHPSGSTKPSDGDIRINKKLENAAKTLDIKFLDSVIITKNEFKSIL